MKTSVIRECAGKGQAVELTDFKGITRRGWLVESNKEFQLLPFDTICETYTYKASPIKKIKFLTNGVEQK